MIYAYFAGTQLGCETRAGCALKHNAVIGKWFKIRESCQTLFLVVFSSANVTSNTMDLCFNFYSLDGGLRMSVFVYEEHV
jgi:hypothetical protein